MLPVKPTATAGTTKVSTPAAKAAPKAAPAKQQPIALPGAAEIAARNNPLPKSSPDDAVKPETMASAPAEKEKSITAATAAAAAKPEDKKYDHLSAPASALASGTATPAEKEKEKENEKVAEKKAESSEEESPATAATGTAKANYEHLSVPASAMHSGTATPVESEMETDMENAFKETPTKEEAEKVFPDIASVASGVQDMQLGEGKTANEQEAKKAEDAVKSVED